MNRSLVLGPAVTALTLLALASAAAHRTAPDVRAIAVGGALLQLAGTRDSLWVLTCDRGCTGEARRSVGRIVRIDARAGRAADSMVIDRPGAIAVSATDIYATDFWRGAVRRINAKTLQVAGRLRLTLPFTIVTTTSRDNAFLPEAVAVGSGSVWIATARGALARVDLGLRRVGAMLRLPPDAFQGIAAGGDAIWLSESLLGVYRVSAKTDRLVARIPVGPRSGRFVPVELYAVRGKLLAVGEWTNGGAATNRNGLALVDTARNHVQSVTPLPAGQLTSAYGLGSLWVARVDGSSLERINPQTGRSVGRFHTHIGTMLAVAGGHLWTAFHDGTVRRVSAR
jgi:streptogramin lyase